MGDVSVVSLHHDGPASRIKTTVLQHKRPVPRRSPILTYLKTPSLPASRFQRPPVLQTLKIVHISEPTRLPPGVAFLALPLKRPQPQPFHNEWRLDAIRDLRQSGVRLPTLIGRDCLKRDLCFIDVYIHHLIIFLVYLSYLVKGLRGAMSSSGAVT